MLPSTIAAHIARRFALDRPTRLPTGQTASTMRTPTRREEIIDAIAARIASATRPHPVRVAIDGVDAEGKTTLADELRCALAQGAGSPGDQGSIDGFHNPRKSVAGVVRFLLRELKCGWRRERDSWGWL